MDEQLDMVAVTLNDVSEQEKCHVVQQTFDKWMYKKKSEYVSDPKSPSRPTRTFPSVPNRVRYLYAPYKRTIKYSIVLKLVGRGDDKNGPVSLLINGSSHTLWVGQSVEVQVSHSTSTAFTFKYFKYYPHACENNTKVGSIEHDLRALARNSDEITLVASDGTQFYLSKMLFMARSEAFRAMVTNDTKEQKEIQVNFNEMNQDVLEKLVMFLTSDKVDQMDDNIAYQLGLAAHKYKLPVLFEQVEDYFVTNCNGENSPLVLELSYLHQSRKLASAYAAKICKKNEFEKASSSSCTSLHKPRSFQDDLLALKMIWDKISLVASNGKEHSVSKLFFTAQSKVFKAMFENDTKEKKENRVHFKDMALNVLEKFFMFIITGKVDELDSSTAHQLGLLAHQYDLPLLFHLVEEYFCNNCNKDNATFVIELAYLHKSTQLASAYGKSAA